MTTPIWQSLGTLHSSFSQGGDLARRFHPEIGPLAGLKEQSPEAYAALGELLSPGEFAVLFLDSAPKLPPEWLLQLHRSGDQMVCASASDVAANNFSLEALGEADVPEMLELTKLTDPGPFRQRTIELGEFLGIREDGRLAAMAGRRLALPGYIEVSGSLHPS